MGSKIVIVEDEPALLKALNIELLGNGYDVLSVNDGESALSLIKKVRPDLILLDILLPKLSGFEIIKALKKDKNTHQIPIVILSNMGQKEQVDFGLGLGAESYIIKSNTDLRAVTKKVKHILSVKK